MQSEGDLSKMILERCETRSTAPLRARERCSLTIQNQAPYPGDAALCFFCCPIGQQVGLRIRGVTE